MRPETELFLIEWVGMPLCLTLILFLSAAMVRDILAHLADGRDLRSDP